MALLATRKKGSLADFADRLAKCRKQAEVVEASIVTASKTRASRLAALAEEGIDDPQSLVERRSEISAAEASLVRQKEALQASIETLQERCGQLAVAEARAEVASLRSRLEPLTLERSRLSDRLVAIGVEEDAILAEISEAEDAVRWAAAEYDSGAKANAEGLRVQERERVAWIARASREAREAELLHESPRVRRLVEEEQARLRAERSGGREKQHADAVESWRDVTGNIETVPEFVSRALREEQ